MTRRKAHKRRPQSKALDKIGIKRARRYMFDTTVVPEILITG